MRLIPALAISITILFAGCGTLGNMVIQDNSLQQRAAFALNTTADQLTISNRQGSIDGAVNFVATTKGKSYQCYITTVGGVVNSQAICSGANSVKSNTGQSCNALLRAANRC